MSRLIGDLVVGGVVVLIVRMPSAFTQLQVTLQTRSLLCHAPPPPVPSAPKLLCCPFLHKNSALAPSQTPLCTSFSVQPSSPVCELALGKFLDVTPCEKYVLSMDKQLKNESGNRKEDRHEQKPPPSPPSKSRRPCATTSTSMLFFFFLFLFFFFFFFFFLSVINGKKQARETKFSIFSVPKIKIETSKGRSL